MTFTRRPTSLGNPADYEFLYEGKAAGRCYRSHFGIHGQGWRWSIYGTSLCGIEETLDAAQERFKEAYRQWQSGDGGSRSHGSGAS